jgi:transposase
MNIKKFVKPLTGSENDELRSIYKNHSSCSVRIRAQALLLSHRGFDINTISTIFDVHRNTVSRWIDQWNERQIDGILTCEGQGRPRIFSEDEEKTLILTLANGPRSLKRVAVQMEEETGKKASIWTLKRVVKDFDKCWKRIRKTVFGRPDPDEYKALSKKLSELIERDKNGQIDLIYFDESGFNLTPQVPYAWQSKGREGTLRIPSSHSKRMNVLGFLHTRTLKLTSFLVEHSVNSSTVISLMDQFCSQIDKKTVVVIDNAPIHTSRAFNEKVDEWKESGLELFFLPTYSPELNLIEILWRKIKYEWIPFSAYKSIDRLRDEMNEILNNFGSIKYHINFA